MWTAGWASRERLMQGHRQASAARQASTQGVRSPGGVDGRVGLVVVAAAARRVPHAPVGGKQLLSVRAPARVLRVLPHQRLRRSHGSAVADRRAVRRPSANGKLLRIERYAPRFWLLFVRMHVHASSISPQSQLQSDAMTPTLLVRAHSHKLPCGCGICCFIISYCASTRDDPRKKARRALRS